MPLKLEVEPALRVCKLKTASGLGYSVLRAVNGPKPAAQDVAVVNYIGYLAATGEVFDQSDAPIDLPLGAVIPGFSEGLQLMPKGSIYRICIPSELGYKAKPTGPIPPNSNLVFQIQLVEIKKAPAAPAN
ncbi:MAG: FKBP-type peptidyl-prolyl cis-trans isomerase [Novosphingobium sp.]